MARQVAAFEGYFPPMAQHLLDAKLRHWEKSLRELAAVALASAHKGVCWVFDRDRKGGCVPWRGPEARHAGGASGCRA